VHVHFNSQEIPKFCKPRTSLPPPPKKKDFMLQHKRWPMFLSLTFGDSDSGYTKFECYIKGISRKNVNLIRNCPFASFYLGFINSRALIFFWKFRTRDFLLGDEASGRYALRYISSYDRNFTIRISRRENWLYERNIQIEETQNVYILLVHIMVFNEIVWTNHPLFTNTKTKYTGL
jgi:hypothetical protein